MNQLLGPDQNVTPLRRDTPQNVHEALDAVLIQALAREPCVVSFSGGRDSSAILALAVDAARRHGLTAPVPVTLRFRGDPRTKEEEWQQMVLTHLGVRSAEVLHLGDELEALGAAARDFLGRHGARWPGNAFMHRPIIEAAAGGTVLTGIGGDELFSTRSMRRTAAGFLSAHLPAAWRQRQLRRGAFEGYMWLTTAGRELAQRSLAAEEVRWPHRWDHAVHYWYRSRSFAGLDGTVSLIGSDFGVDVVNPFLHREVLSAVAAAGGTRGFSTRTEAMQRLCGSLLPPAVIGRGSKAVFGGALWGPATQAFMRDWDGIGVDQRYVDIDRLRHEVGSEDPDYRTILLVQRAWLADQAGRISSSSVTAG